MSNVVSIDFNDGRPQGWFSPRQIENARYVADLKAKLEGAAESVLQYLWPAGKIVGKEFEVGDVNGAPGKSLKISLRKGKLGVGCDFAGDEITGDLIDCWAYARLGRKARGKDFAEICEEIEAWLGHPFKPTPKPAERGPELGPPTAIYNYTDAAGQILVTIKRHDPPGGKTFRQWDAVRNAHNMPPDNRPLYNLPGISTTATVVFVEGEKAAQALIDKGIVATCAMGGSKAPAEKTDWSPLAGKNVVIWPDADEPGAAYAEAVAVAMKTAGAKPAILPVPAGKAGGWDAADAVEEGADLTAILSLPPRKPGRQLELGAWNSAAFSGAAPPIQWCVDSVMPLAKAGLLVAMGDAGKGILTLDLGLKIAAKKAAGDELTCLGGKVSASGSVVILAAEDDRDSIHRRLAALDPKEERRDRLYVVPLPNAGGPLPIVKTSSTVGPYSTPEWDMLREQLSAIPDLRLVVLDPLASFVHADVNADPAAGAFVTGLLASLATETGATVLLPHHMAKRDKPINTPEEARAAIRGSTAIVDGVRFAYALWSVEEQEGRRVCAALGQEWQRNRVLKGAIVKSNDPADRSVRAYVRSLDTGLLIDRTEAIKADRALQRDLMADALCLAIVSAASAGYPYTKTGSTGVYERRAELPEDIQELGKHSLMAIVDRLMSLKRIAAVRYKGQTSPWLDAPKGDFARGLIDLQQGSYHS